MGYYASKVVNLAKSWIGKNEKDGSHHSIINLYNAHVPLARGYKVTYTDAWCATFISALFIQLGYTSIFPTECGCENMINLCKAKGIWKESDSFKPSVGSVVFYDWQDSGDGDNTGYSDHVGLVAEVNGNKLLIIEGNKDNAVSTRELAVNGKYIRGYAVPKYDKETSLKLGNYTIQKGDTLSEIAKRFNCSIKDILNANSALINDANDICVGWVISVPKHSESSETVPKPSKDYEKIGRAFESFMNDIESLASYETLMSLL